MQSPEPGADEQALAASAQEGQIAAHHLEMDCQSVTSETSLASAHDSVDNHSPMPQPIPIALTLAQPPLADTAEREYATLTPLSSAVTVPHVLAPVHYTSYVQVPSVAVSQVEAAPMTVSVTTQQLSQAQPVSVAHVTTQVSPAQPTPIILTAVPRKPTPVQHVQPTVQKQVPSGKGSVQVLSTEELTRDQLVLLEKAYRDSPYPSYHQLASELKIEVFKVKAWFRKRRRNLHTEIGIEMSKEDEQKVFKQFITQHHDSWKEGQPPPGAPQSSQRNTMFRLPTPSPGAEEGQENKSGEGKPSEQDGGDRSRQSPAQLATSAGDGTTNTEAAISQTTTLQSQPKPALSTENQIIYAHQPQQQLVTIVPTTTKSKPLPKSRSKSKSSTSTIRSLLKKEVKYDPVVAAPAAPAPPVTSPQPQVAAMSVTQSQAEQNTQQPMTYIPSMYQNTEIDNLMREREYLGRLLHQQQMEWQETRKKLVDCDRRLAKVTSNVQATTYTTTSHQQAVVSEGEQKWQQVPQTQYHQVAVPVSAAPQYVTQVERPPSQGSPAVMTEEHQQQQQPQQQQQVQTIRLVMTEPHENANTNTSKESEQESEAPQLTQLYAAAPIIVQPGTENHYVWPHDQAHQEQALQYHHGMYQQALDGNNNKDQAMHSAGSVDNSQGQPSPYYSDYSGSPVSSHDTHENHGHSGNGSKRRNRTTYTRSNLVQEQTGQEAETR